MNTTTINLFFIKRYGALEHTNPYTSRCMTTNCHLLSALFPLTIPRSYIIVIPELKMCTATVPEVSNFLEPRNMVLNYFSYVSSPRLQNGTAQSQNVNVLLNGCRYSQSTSFRRTAWQCWMAHMRFIVVCWEPHMAADRHRNVRALKSNKNWWNLPFKIHRLWYIDILQYRNFDRHTYCI